MRCVILAGCLAGVAAAGCGSDSRGLDRRGQERAVGEAALEYLEAFAARDEDAQRADLRLRRSGGTWRVRFNTS